MKSLRLLVVGAILLALSLSDSIAQDSEAEPAAFPECDIFLFDVSISPAKTELTNCRNVTDAVGYENQPSFVPDSKSFLFSKSDGPQTDIFEYFIESAETKRVTKSKGMEFSPVASPDNKLISYVSDGVGANQSVWQIDRQSPNKPVWVLANQPEREPVGYYCWNRETGFFLFWSRYGFSIRLLHDSKPLTHYVSGSAVPTTPQQIPQSLCFSFVHRQGNGEVWIKELDPESKSVRPLIKCVGSNSHYGWSPDGSIFMVERDVLFRWSGKEAESWVEVVDLSQFNIKDATRLTISPNGNLMAVVGVNSDTVNSETD